MKFEDTFFSKEHYFSIGIEKESGKYYLSIPVSNGIVDYEEYYEINSDKYEEYQLESSLANEFAEKCRRRQFDHLLIVKPGKNRGVAC
ncbi:hypothetical protein L3V77_10550 [Vibrio sp. DW001]|uniref:hypothetical protein n=1 Tax=Vibrio sp. DW001 TaxID=2912315 RepID=UPI0023AFFC70|nr:hypothetical protein [Vibrio sp. DW001]WED25506.1 hypothetical protein L3V77_10550 [Vibrio sp. DW001]